MSDKYTKRQSTRLRKRTSRQPVNPEDEDDLATDLVAVVMAAIRNSRDKVDQRLVSDVDISEVVIEDTIRDTVTHKMEKIDTSVSRLENNFIGNRLESLLKDPQYGTPIKSKPASPSKSKVTAPTEVKEEELSLDQPCFSGSTENVLTVNTSVSQIGGPDTVEKAAKHEAHTMARIAELRRCGMWSSSRLPLCVEPPRNKTHWDYVLEEVKWMANDFRQERIWKRGAAKKLSTTIARQAREKQAEIEKAQTRVVKDHRRSCAMIAKMVRDFWLNVDKVVDHRKQAIIDSKKRKALDQHLQFIVGEADKLSQVVAEGIVAESSSKTPSLQGKDDDRNDKDFSSDESDSDDETTIAKAEKQLKNEDVKGEVYALGKEADMGFDDLLDSLPPEYLAALGIAVPSTSKQSVEEVKEEEEEEEDSEDEDEDDEMESDDEPLVRASSSKSVEDNSNEKESDDEPLLKKKKTEKEDERMSVEDSDDDEPLADKIRRSREKSKDNGGDMKKEEEADEDEKEEKEERESESQEKVKLDNVDFAKLKSDNSDERQQELTHIAEEALKFQPKGYTLETTQVKTGVPHMLRGTLREYQMVGLDWLVTLYDKNLNGILADEMGLGKTIQTVALLAHLASVERIWGPHLIVVPTSVILNWEMEFKKWCPSLKILTYFGSVKERAEKRKGWMKDDSFHVCITSYKVITTDIRSFKMRSWQYLILDEAQNIKNWKSQRWQTLLNVRARRRLLLTGTPLQNSLMELWSLLHFLMPAIFASHDDFKDWFSNPLTGMMDGSVEFNKGLLDRLHKVLRPFILRRMKAEVEKQMPSKTEHVVKCPLSKRQRYLYDDFMSQRATRDNLKSGNMMSVLNIVMQLRKCCNHPNLFTPREEQTPLVVPSIKTVLPACVFDIVSDDPLQDGVKEIPECFNLTNRKAAWRTSNQASRPLVEELVKMEPPLQIPRVPGFKFVRPVMEKPSSQPSRAPEMFLVVEEGNDDIGGLLKERVHVTMDGDKVLVNTDGKLGADRIRVCQGVPGGSFTDMDGDSNGRRTSWKGSGGLPPPPMSVRESGSTPSLSSTSLDSKRSSTSVYATRRPVTAMHSPIRSTTVAHSQPTSIRPIVNGDDSKRRNFHEAMQEGALSPIPNFPIPLSPPLKRRKVDIPLVTGPYKEFVSKERLEVLKEERIGRLEKAVMRFEDGGIPLYSWQMISMIWRETRTCRRKDDRWTHSFWHGEWEELGETVRKECEEMVKKFVIYVDGVLTEEPSIFVSSRGRSSYARHAVSHFKLRARRFLSDCDSLVDRNLVAHRMQFPELRLIEYDCGKLQILAKLLRELYIYKHRCLIFTQMSRMLDVLQAFLSHHGYQYFRLDGTTGIEQRQVMMERFNADPRIFCFILSTRSGGVGVNLTGADTVIFYDSDWNPTMDAQAQDRCHRIGQTRNVSIYRLISEKTIEENILKKAMQKRRLGEMAIDEAGFTPDFFRQKDNIRDLFDGENVEDIDVDTPIDAPSNQIELDKAMASLEDEQDVAAAKIVTSEAKADIKEFDERAGGITVIGGGDDGEFGELLGQLKPIEKYAIKFLEAEYKPEFEEEVKEAEALLHQKKKEWNRAHERAMRDENEAEGIEGDPSLSSLNRDLTMDEDFHDFDVLFEDQFMPTWRPLTPPLSDLDEELYSNELSNQFYEDYLMDEIDLPSTVHELPRPLNKYSLSPVKKQRESNSAVLQLLNAASPVVMAEAIAAEAANKSASILHQSISTTSIGGMSSPAPLESPSVRRSSSSNRKSVRSLYESMPGRTSKGEMRRPTTPPPAEREAKDYEGPEWNILEDYALLQAVLSEQRLTHMSPNEKSGIKLNWEYISGFVNRVTGNYRSPRQCSVHYQMVVLPREDGRILTLDPITKKPRKLNLSATEITHLRKGRTSTHQQYTNDVEGVLRDKLMDRMRAVKRVREKRPMPFVRFNPHEIPSTGSTPPHHRTKLNIWNVTDVQSAENALLTREDKRTILMTQEKEARSIIEAKAADEREKALLASSISSIIVRPSALNHQLGQPLVAPPLITLEVPLPPRCTHPSTHLPPIHMNTVGGGGGGQGIPPIGGGDRGGMGGGSLPLPQSHQQLQPLPSLSTTSSLQSNQQPHPMAEHLPMGGMTRRVGTPLGGGGGGSSQGMMGSGGGQGGQGGGGPSSQYVVVGGGEGGSQTPTSIPTAAIGGSGGGGGQPQQVVASRMSGMMGRGDGREGGSSGMIPSTGGQQQQQQQQPMYRAVGGTTAQKRAVPGGGGIQRMSGYVDGAPSSQVHIARGQSVGRTEMRPQFNARVAQRVMPGGQTNRVYMTTGGGTGSGNNSPSHVGGDGGGGQSAQGGRYIVQQPHQQPHTSLRVGIQPPRMGGVMTGNGGGGGGGPPKRSHSIVNPKPGSMLVSRSGTGLNQMRGSQQINRFPTGTSSATQRMMNVVVRDGVSQGGQLMRGVGGPSGSSGGGGGGQSGMGGGGGNPSSSIQSRSIPSTRPIINQRTQPSHIPSSINLSTIDSSSSSSIPSSIPPTIPQSDTVLPSQSGPLPSISLSSTSSSSSYPNPSSQHSM